jgi:hypothetical protein
MTCPASKKAITLSNPMMRWMRRTNTRENHYAKKTAYIFAD